MLEDIETDNETTEATAETPDVPHGGVLLDWINNRLATITPAATLRLGTKRATAFSLGADDTLHVAVDIEGSIAVEWQRVALSTEILDAIMPQLTRQ